MFHFVDTYKDASAVREDEEWSPSEHEKGGQSLFDSRFLAYELRPPPPPTESTDISLEWGRSFNVNPFKPSQSYAASSKGNSYGKGKKNTAPSISYSISNSYGPPAPQSPPIIHIPPPPPSHHPTSCNFITHGQTFYLQSPRYSIANYPPNINCHYTIKKLSNACSIELDFRDFHLESVPNCSADWLLIAGHKYCGIQSSRKSELPSIICFMHSLHRYFPASSYSCLLFSFFFSTTYLFFYLFPISLLNYIPGTLHYISHSQFATWLSSV